LPEDLRRRAHGELLCAYLEFGQYHGIASYIGTAPPRLWKHTLIKYGWPVEFLGEVTDVGFAEKIRSSLMRVSAEILANVRRTAGIAWPVLPDLDLPMEKAA
jgi:N-acyl-L-homoserine lactone synthetase